LAHHSAMAVRVTPVRAPSSTEVVP
jgi:hypothetical protein